MNRLPIRLLLLNSLFYVACSGSADDNAHTTATTMIAPAAAQTLSVATQPDWIKPSLIPSCSGVAAARPEIVILSPRPNQILATTTVTIRVNLRGASTSLLTGDEAKDAKPNGALGIADHAHFILDNSPYEEMYAVNKPFELHDVGTGRHVLRVVAVRPWHESYKNAGAFQILSFTVNSNAGVKSDDASVGKTAIDPTKPLLTSNSPQGEFKGERADPLLIDFWVSNAKLRGDGGEYRIRCFIDDDEARYFDKWEPVWLAGWLPGKHTVRLELLGADQWPVRNGNSNITTHEIKVSR